MTVEVRTVKRRDADDWLRMRAALWPDSPADHLRDVEGFLECDDPVAETFIAVTHGGGPVGFLECRLREYAEGCTSAPVGYVEGWWVDPEHRGRGIGRLLMGAAEDWARSRGAVEMASDAEVPNTLGHMVHRSLGYEEAGRLVCYRKDL